MFKKKPIYIVGIILFTLILIADVAIYIAAPTGGRGNMPGRGGSFNGQMPEGFDSGSFDSSSLPEGFDGSGMPQGGNFDFGDFDGEMPEGFDGYQMPQGGFGGMGGFDGSEDFTMPEGGQGSFEDFSGEMPEGFDAESFDSANIPNRGQSGNSGFLSTVRSAFWPILIVCVLGDAACIFMLVWISKKKEKQEPDSSDDDVDDSHNRSHTNTVLGVIALLLTGAVVLASVSSGGAKSEIVTELSVQQAEASLQDIASVFSGSGTLLNADETQLEIPVSVTVTGYAVKNGDTVAVGDVIANVDTTSVQKEIYEIQSLISEMDIEISEVQGDTLDSKITARADGRVKAIYAAEGDTVSGAMYENGAVMLISLGGSMTVVIESSETVSVGQNLTVTLSDGTETAGKVQQVQNGKITVTTTDDGPAPEDTVSVATEEGTVLGTGTLSVSSPLKVTGFWGTVDSIYVEVGDTVKTGDTLLSLVNTADAARYQQLLRERQELTEMLSRLSAMYQSGTIQATNAGIISGIPEDAAYVQLSASGGYSAVFLSQLANDPPAGGSSYPEGGQLPTEGGQAPSEGGGMPPEGGELPTEGGVQLPEGEVPQADGTYAGQVTKVTYGALHIAISEADMSGFPIANLETVDTALFVSQRKYSPELTTPVNLYQNEQTVPGAVSDIQAGDKVLLYIQNGTVTQIDYIPGSPEGSEGNTLGDTGSVPGGIGGMGSTQMPSMGGSFESQTEDEDDEEAVYEVETTSLCAVIPAEAMTIEVSVDELDILTLAAQQEAAITLDALPGQSFSGTVMKINPTGTNEGGSTKYTVTVEVPRTEQMLPGMNASVLIEVSRLDSVLTIPAAAVQEDGNRTYVYTALDEKTGQPTNPIDVTTGSSDGESIEILSGLSQGETVYYSYADSIIYR